VTTETDAHGQDGNLSRAERDVLRQMIRHEDQLRNDRLGWLLTLNGFLFAALGFAWDGNDSAGLVFVLALLGVTIGASALAAMKVSHIAIAGLRRPEHESSEQLAPIAGATHRDLPCWVRILVPWRVLPWALMLIWPLLFVLRVAR
jgi:hypothetical protein